MATGLFSSSTTKRHNGGSREGSIEDQLHEIREDIGKLVTLITDRGLAASEEAKAKARGAARAMSEADLQDLLASGEQMLSELRSRYANTKEVGRVMREHPIATLGTAAAIGLVAAALLRR
jgi:ElaB/YqjD/DUF883 family membrane-anchored ribosome-binding protein